jgi:hypothetical protein
MSIPLSTVMRYATHYSSTGPARSHALANIFLIRRDLFVVRETLLAPEMSIKHGEGNSDIGEGARGAHHTFATCMVTAVGGLTRAQFVTCIKYVLLRHRASYIHDHVSVVRNHRRVV